MRSKTPLLTVIMPVYNEEHTIEPIIKSVFDSGIDIQLIVVDDGSKDNTLKIIKEMQKKLSFELICLPRKSGKGYAIRTAIPRIKGEYTIIQDADMEYDPHQYSEFIAQAIKTQADAILGYRIPHSRAKMHHLQYLANRIITALVNIVTGLKLKDVATGYKFFKSSCLKQMKLQSCGFEIDIEIIIALWRAGFKISEIPITYSPRTYRLGKKIRWTDAIKICLSILYFRAKKYA